MGDELMGPTHFCVRASEATGCAWVVPRGMRLHR